MEKNPQQRFQSARDLAFALLTNAPAVVRRTASKVGFGSDDRPSVAVLPFANLSADPEQEFFCDGMAEEIINALAQVRGLRVVARTSAFAFKGKHEDVREIGSRLDVGAIVEGSVRKADDRLRITAQLIDIRDGSHLWSERFDRRLEDVFAIQDEIALAIVENLKVKLLAGEKASLVRSHTDNLEAHNAYLVGLFEWNKMSPEGFVRCQELFQEAIHLDPEFAPAYAQLADAFTSVTWWADQCPTEALARTIPLVEQALAIDPDLAHAHSVSGQCSTFFERDLVAGERSLRRAVELAPNDASGADLPGPVAVHGRARDGGLGTGPDGAQSGPAFANQQRVGRHGPPFLGSHRRGAVRDREAGRENAPSVDASVWAQSRDWRSGGASRRRGSWPSGRSSYPVAALSRSTTWLASATASVRDRRVTRCSPVCSNGQRPATFRRCSSPGDTLPAARRKPHCAVQERPSAPRTPGSSHIA